MNVSKVSDGGLMFTQTGTPYYASPEVWKDKPYDSKSDIWSLGCVLFEICALLPPFTASNMKGLYKKVIKGDHNRIPDVYSNDLANVVNMCLQVIPTNRPSASQLLRKKEIVLHLRENKIEERKQNSSINLLDTIKLPSNMSLIKGRLPTPKYHSDFESIKHESPKKLRNMSARGRDSTLSKNLLEKERSLSALKRYQNLPQSSNSNASIIRRHNKMYRPPISNRAAEYKPSYDRPALQLPAINRAAGIASLGYQYHLRQKSESRNSSRIIPIGIGSEGSHYEIERGYKRRADIAVRQKQQKYLINKAFGLPITPITRT